MDDRTAATEGLAIHREIWDWQTQEAPCSFVAQTIDQTLAMPPQGETAAPA
jgi:hypothetical protein